MPPSMLLCCSAQCLYNVMSHVICSPAWDFVKADKSGYSQWVRTRPRLWIWSSMSKAGTKSWSLEIEDMVWLSLCKYQSPFMLRGHRPNVGDFKIDLTTRESSHYLSRASIISAFYSLALKKKKKIHCLWSFSEPTKWLMDMCCVCWQFETRGPNPNKAHDLSQKVKHRFVTRRPNVEILLVHLVSNKKKMHAPSSSSD